MSTTTLTSEHFDLLLDEIGYACFPVEQHWRQRLCGNAKGSTVTPSNLTHSNYDTLNEIFKITRELEDLNIRSIYGSDFVYKLVMLYQLDRNAYTAAIDQLTYIAPKRYLNILEIKPSLIQSISQTADAVIAAAP